MNALRLAAILTLVPAAAMAQTANGSPTVGRPNRAAAGTVQPLGAPLPKPTAAERAERRKLERDLHICTGC